MRSFLLRMCLAAGLIVATGVLAIDRVWQWDTAAAEHSIRHHMKPVATLLRVRAAEQFVEDLLFPDRKRKAIPAAPAKDRRASTQAGE